jgi:minichromosome maintenance protein 10
MSDHDNIDQFDALLDELGDATESNVNAPVSAPLQSAVGHKISNDASVRTKDGALAPLTVSAGMRTLGPRKKAVDNAVSESLQSFEAQHVWSAPSYKRPSSSSSSLPASKRVEGTTVKCKFSGLRLLDLAVNSSDLDQKMQGKRVFSLQQIAQIKSKDDIQGDYVVFGCLGAANVRSSSTSKRPMLAWTLTDLSSSELSVFIFGDAIGELKSEATGHVYALLNPNILHQTSGQFSQGTALSINRPGQVLHIGRAVDFAICKGTRKDGTPCNKIVNLAQTQYCPFHIQGELKRLSSSRQELNTMRVTVRNPNLIPGMTMKSLSNGLVASTANQLQSSASRKRSSTAAGNADVQKGVTQGFAKMSSKWSSDDHAKASAACPIGMHYINHLKENGAHQPISFRKEEKKEEKDVSKLGLKLQLAPVDPNNPNAHRKVVQQTTTSPQTADPPGMILLNFDGVSFTSGSASNRSAKENIPTSSASSIAASAAPGAPAAKKARLADVMGITDAELKKAEKAELHFTNSSAGKAALEEIRRKENARLDRLAQQEKMAIHMRDTNSMQVTAWCCPLCNITSQAYPQRCKEQGHRIKKVDATKRFFECGNCKTRTFTLNVQFPSFPCDKCGMRQFHKCGMGKKDYTKDPTGSAFHLAGPLYARGEETENRLRARRQDTVEEEHEAELGTY